MQSLRAGVITIDESLDNGLAINRKVNTTAVGDERSNAIDEQEKKPLL